MRTMVTMVAAFATLAAAMGAQNQVKPDADTAKLILRNERALYDAIAHGDKAAYQALVSADGKWATPDGVVPMGSLTDRLAAFELPTWEIENPSVTALDGLSPLVVFYTRTGGGRLGERPFTPLTLASTMWEKRGDRWIAVDHWEKALPGSVLIPSERAQWEMGFAEVEAAAGLADLQAAPPGTVDARVIDRPWSGMGHHPFLHIVKRDGTMRAHLFEFFWATRSLAPRPPEANGTVCRDRVCVRPLEVKEQLDWAVVFESLAHQDACGLKVGGPGLVCGDCEQVLIKTTSKGRYREQSCQLPDAGTPAATLREFMIRSGRAAAR